MKQKIKWLEPWHPLKTSPYPIEREFYSEVAKNHILFGKKVIPIGRRHDRDEFLFQVIGTNPFYAVVHLTYSKQNGNGEFPLTKVYKDLDSFIDNCMFPDHMEL